MFKYLILASVLLTTSAYADTKTKPSVVPVATCGKTALECQVVVDQYLKTLNQINAAYRFVSQQRNNVLAGQADQEVNNYLNSLNKPLDKPQ